MTDEHQRAQWGDLVDHGAEVAAELVDVVGVEVGAPGAAVAALVVEHQASPPAQGLALVVPGVEVQRVAVGEHDGQAAGRSARARIRLVDLDVQRRAIVGGHFANLAVQPAEALAVEGLGGQRGAAQDGPLGDGAQGCPGGQCPRCQQPATGRAQGGRDIGAHGDCSARPDSTYSRGTRGPIRVTISYPMVPSAWAHSSADHSPWRPGPNR